MYLFGNFQVLLRKNNKVHNYKRFLRGNTIKQTERFIGNAQCDINIETKLLKVAIIGTPNAGKSTLINNLMDRKVCPTSNKVHTTRQKSMAIFTEGHSQIVFLDTPGLVNWKEKQKFQLEKNFLKDSKSTLNDADLIGVIHDVTSAYTREKLDIKVIKLLEEYCQKPSILVLNKIDVLKSKRKLLDLTRILTENCVNGQPIPSNKPVKDNTNIRGWPHFQDIFMVSALTGDGTEYLRNYLIQQVKQAKWMFPKSVWSDQTAENLIVRTIKAKFLDFLPQEIPYGLRPELEYFDITDEGIIKTSIIVHCATKRISKLVAGASEGRLRQIIESAQQDLQNTFQNSVQINIVLHHSKD